RESQYFFVDPTIISNVTDEMDIMHDETFGPVAPITTFSSIDEAIQKANDTPFGLAAYYFTNDYRTGQYIYEHLDYGVIGWNDGRSEEHTSELQSRFDLVCRLLLEK